MSYKISSETYDEIEQCFDTLTEFIQGPCKDNQDAISSTKFLEYAVQVLTEDEKLYVVIEEERSSSKCTNETHSL